jgi:hypothetical protein
MCCQPSFEEVAHRGKVSKGKVLLDDLGALAEGTEVEVRAVKRQDKKKRPKKRPRTLAERLEPFIGKATHLPAEMFINLDQYLHGPGKAK